MKIKKETLTEMKILVSNIEKIDCLQRTYDNLFIMQGYSLDLEQLSDRIRNKKLKKKYQKRINKIIKKL
jgi:predicted nucleic acid-binding protein